MSDSSEDSKTVDSATPLVAYLSRKWLIVLRPPEEDEGKTVFFEQEGPLTEAKRLASQRVTAAGDAYRGFTIHIYDFLTGTPVGSRRVGYRTWKGK